MKKNILKVTTMALLVAALLTSTAFAGEIGTVSGEAKTVKAATAQKEITRDEAKAIVKDEVPGCTIKVLHKGTDDGRAVYEVIAKKGNTVYEMNVDLYTGEVYDLDSENVRSKNTAIGIGSSFTVAKVKAKIKRWVSNPTIIYIQLTRDDGRYVYEGEAYKNGKIYSFEMNAYTGSYIERESESM